MSGLRRADGLGLRGPDEILFHEEHACGGMLAAAPVSIAGGSGFGPSSSTSGVDRTGGPGSICRLRWYRRFAREVELDSDAALAAPWRAFQPARPPGR